MHWIESYLRPLSQINTGTEGGIEKKAEVVSSITTENSDVDIIQESSVPVLYDHPLETTKIQGMTIVEDSEKRIREHTVEHPERHWWIITREIFEQDFSLRVEADIFDLLLALNLCTNDPVIFSQSPGQTVGRAYQRRRYPDSNGGVLKYRGDIKPGSFPNAILSANEIPEEVVITGDLVEAYAMVREFRSKNITSDEEMDLRVALHMYDDALTSSIWTTITNLYYVCENILISGHGTAEEKDQAISELTNLSESESEGWRRSVNRLKHPDSGGSQSIIDGGLEIPSVDRLRQAANTILIHDMREHY